MKARKVQSDIKAYCDGIFDVYPRYSEYLSLNNKIANSILEIYYNKDIPKNIEYETVFDDISSIQLASEILENISSELKVKFLHCIKRHQIFLTDNCISSTYIVDNDIRSSVKRNKNIIDSISLVHEFFHYIHLEKYSDLSYEDYYYFSEILGLIGDFYSIFYLINNKPELKKDTRSYLSETICSLAMCADTTLPFGIVLQIYKSKHSLSKLTFMKYIKENNISKKFMNVLNYYKDVEHFNYHEDVRYVFAFPIAFQISKMLIQRPYEIYQYNEIFNILSQTKVEECLHRLKLDYFFDNEDKLSELMNEVQNMFLDIFTIEDFKVKKYGEL